MALGAVVLRFSQTGLRVIQLLASILVLGIFSYYLAVLADHHLPKATWIKGVEGVSGAAILYLLFAVLLTLFLAGKRVFGFLMIFLDFCFMACFMFVAVATRGGAGSCSGIVHTPLGNGPANSKAAGYGADGFGFGSGENVTYLPNLRRACKLETAAFAVSLLNIFLFIITAVLGFLLVRHHQKEKRLGATSANNYTSGSGKVPFWKRMGRKNRAPHNTRDAELATSGTIRKSHETGYTGTTVNHAGVVDEPKYGEPTYGQPGYGQTHGTTATY